MFQFSVNSTLFSLLFMDTIGNSSQIAEKEGDSYQSQVKALPTSPDVDEVKKDSKDI
jgi:hypothetical protein